MCSKTKWLRSVLVRLLVLNKYLDGLGFILVNQKKRCLLCALWLLIYMFFSFLQFSSVFFSWLLDHVIYFKLRKKEIIAKLSKFTKWQLFALKITTFFTRTILSTNKRTGVWPQDFKIWKINSGLWAVKSVNLQYITLGCLDDGTNESSTKSLMFQVLFCLYFLQT